MKPVIVTLMFALSVVEPVQAAWLLWKRTVVDRNVEGVPRSLSSQTAVDRWDLLNALESRNECLDALRVEYKNAYEDLAATHPGEPINQKPPGDGIHGSITAGKETRSGPSAKPTQLYYEYAFWCLPHGVDPRSTTIGSGRK